METIRHYKRLVRNMRKASECAAKLRACNDSVRRPGSTHFWRFVPAETLNEAIRLLERLSGSPSGSVDESKKGT